jgi:hypothetical protein
VFALAVVDPPEAVWLLEEPLQAYTPMIAAAARRGRAIEYAVLIDSSNAVCCRCRVIRRDLRRIMTRMPAQTSGRSLRRSEDCQLDTLKASIKYHRRV